ncbi:hypothetical protein N7466_001168 [Penicillium verhagenii]|uniref:uncharacterized protein n=1 Tax=Penicillium verhagenii TaxID=1562060 RepID=UPI0025452245|nr:uncharacterized protein N7466_001168 [Penicillium verhagenii]KAJ5948153.1 hypothetical protein N7466_001168 [Penicillium verhagenii]
MTTTSSLLPSGMEIPVGEDLEMASPYQGQADDFDIDIDLMEDHVSNMDSDMMGADDFQPTSQPSLFPNDATDDADMVDEPSEGSMVDIDPLADEDHDIEVQYEDDNITYEADMLEGDTDETPNVAVPSINIEPTSVIENQLSQPSQLAPETAITNSQETQYPPSGILPAELEQQPIFEASESLQETAPVGDVENIENEEIQPPEIAEPIQNENDTALEEETKLGEDTNEVTESAIPGVQEPHAPDHPVESQTEDLETSKALSPKTDPVIAEHEETHVSNEAEHENAHDDESLHTVKVIYQDNEISLFPPLEGDSAETFFLHDEGVAYDNVGRLFNSLREVLLDNIAEHDTLVIDIDSLGIQITEDSSNTSKITLHQILDIYLRLCHNDGIHDPDALYLNLSSRSAIHHELASLDTAAKEGKGLSQIQLWADYDEEPLTTDETANTHEQSGDELKQDQQTDQSGVPDEGVAPHETNLPGQDAKDDSGETENSESVVNEAHIESGLTDADANLKPGLHSNETYQEEYDGEDHYQDDRYDNMGHSGEQDYPEGPKTESTGTVVPDSELPVPNDQSLEASVEVTQEDSEHHATGEDNQGSNDAELDDDELLGADDLEVADLSAPIPQSDAEVHEGGAQGLESTSQHGEDATEDLEVPAYDDHDSERALEDTADPGIYQESESTLEIQEHPLPEQTPEPENNLLGIAEDLISPAKNDQHNQSKNTDDVDDEYFGDDFMATTFEDDGDDQESYEDEYNYDPELDAEEETELGEINPSSTDPHAPDNLTVKRSREEDDEWELTEATTPEIKRRRPS